MAVVVGTGTTIGASEGGGGEGGGGEWTAWGWLGRSRIPPGRPRSPPSPAGTSGAVLVRRVGRPSHQPGTSRPLDVSAAVLRPRYASLTMVYQIRSATVWTWSAMRDSRR